MNNPPDVLKKILVRKYEEVEQRSKELSIAQLQERIKTGSPVRGFIKAINQRIAEGQSAVIAEVKKASPSKGLLRENFQPADIAKSYQAGGAACLSVLTDKDFFQGSEMFLQQARAACDLPVLRKDFIVDAYQVYEARSIGADCILLIVAALDDSTLHALYELATELGLDVLVEVHDLVELERALALNLKLVGINNRDLHTFKVSIQTTLELLSFIPAGVTVVSESGLHKKEDIVLLRKQQVNSFLIGEAFMREKNPGKALQALMA